jgi:hypothetical protein
VSNTVLFWMAVAGNLVSVLLLTAAVYLRDRWLTLAAVLAVVTCSGAAVLSGRVLLYLLYVPLLCVVVSGVLTVLDVRAGRRDIALVSLIAFVMWLSLATVFFLSFA